MGEIEGKAVRSSTPALPIQEETKRKSKGTWDHREHKPGNTPSDGPAYTSGTGPRKEEAAHARQGAIIPLHLAFSRILF